jgi:hypothetical protein
MFANQACPVVFDNCRGRNASRQTPSANCRADHRFRGSRACGFLEPCSREPALVITKPAGEPAWDVLAQLSFEFDEKGHLRSSGRRTPPRAGRHRRRTAAQARRGTLPTAVYEGSGAFGVCYCCEAAAIDNARTNRELATTCRSLGRARTTELTSRGARPVAPARAIREIP